MTERKKVKRDGEVTDPPVDPPTDPPEPTEPPADPPTDPPSDPPSDPESKDPPSDPAPDPPSDPAPDPIDIRSEFARLEGRISQVANETREGIASLGSNVASSLDNFAERLGDIFDGGSGTEGDGGSGRDGGGGRPTEGRKRSKLWW